MSTSTSTVTDPTPRLSMRSRSLEIAGTAAAFILLVVSALGPGWFFLAGNPASKIPGVTFDFQGLNKLAHSGQVPTNWIQQSYFGWLAWILFVAVIGLIVAALVVDSARWAWVAVAGAIVALVLGVFATKGALTWASYWHNVPNLRLGAYMMIVGLLAVAAIGSRRIRQLRTQAS